MCEAYEENPFALTRKLAEWCFANPHAALSVLDGTAGVFELLKTKGQKRIRLDTPAEVKTIA